MKVIFLDMDGVIVDQTSCYAAHAMLKNNLVVTGYGSDCAQVNPDLVVRLNRIIEATDAKIVMSSSWRSHFKGKDDLQQFYRDVRIIGESLGKTGGEHNRAEEILVWLRSNPDVTHFVILDDESIGEHVDLTQYCVRTRWNVPGYTQAGLQDTDVEKAIWILNNVPRSLCPESY